MSKDTKNIQLAFQLMESLGLEKEVLELYGISEWLIKQDYISFSSNNKSAFQSILLPQIKVLSETQGFKYIEPVMVSLVRCHFIMSQYYDNSFVKLKSQVNFTSSLFVITQQFYSPIENISSHVEVFELMGNIKFENRANEGVRTIVKIAGILRNNSSKYPKVDYNLVYDSFYNISQILYYFHSKRSVECKVIPYNSEYSKLLVIIELEK